MRSTGELTYYAADIAYHQDKLERGYDRVIDVLGADHHGYVGADAAAWQALGGDAGPARVPDHAAGQPASRAASACRCASARASS